MNTRLTPRDANLFKYLLHKKVAKPDQIARDIFECTHQSAVYRRLRKLRNANFIQKSSIHLEGSPKVFYSLTPHGLSILKESGRNEFSQPRLKSDAVAHDLDLVDIDSVFEKFEAVDRIITENELKSYEHLANSRILSVFRKIESDRVVITERANRPIYMALEFEKSRKTKDKYRAKFLDYYLSKNIDAVLYICESNSNKNMLKKIDSEFKNDFVPKFYFSTLKTALGSLNSLKLEGQNGGIIHMK